MPCPTCRAEVPAGARFCPSCGHELVVVGDQRRIATVLFADLVGFTALSETLDPEQVKGLVDRCFERLVVDIESFGGRVDKVVGDAIVALFGAPVAHEDDAERAVRAGLRMQETIAAMGEEVGEPVRMRVGVNTGEVLVGAVRGGREYTAMGDVVNTASRLQEAAAPGTVLVGPDTWVATRDVVEYSDVDAVEAKGKRLPVQAWVARRALVPPGQRRSSRAPLVGRDTELGLLTAVTDTAIERSRAALLLVHGEAGMGKSRLAAATAEHATETLGALVLEGRCVPYGEANVWWPVAEAVRNAASITAETPPDVVEQRLRRTATYALERTGRLDELDRTVAGLHHLLGNESSLRGIDVGRAREEVLRAVVAVTDGYTESRPVVISLSDLHWADQEVLDLVDTLLVRLARRPFVILATARRALQERWRPAPEAANQVVLHLDPLDVSASQRLLAHLGDGTLDDALGELLVERAGGNPFYLEELVSLIADAGVATVDELLATEAGDLPTTLRGLVAARLDALDPPHRQVLDDAAVLGRSNKVDALVRMAEVKRSIEPEVARAQVEQLAAREFFVLSGGSYQFRSEVIREVAYSTLTKADRARSHAGIAAWIEGHEDASREHVVDQLANHWAAAAELVADIGAVSHVPHDVRARALRWLDEAWSRGGPDVFPPNVIALTTRALGLLPTEDPARAAVLRDRAAARAASFELEAAVADVAEAEALLGPGGDPAELGRLALVRAEVLQHRGDLPGALALLDEAERRFVAIGDRAGRAGTLRRRGMALIFAGSFPRADEVLGEALELFEELGDRRGAAWALQHLSWSAYVSGRVDDAERWVLSAVETFDDLGDPGGSSWSRGLLAWVRFHQGRDEEARDLAEAVEVDARERGERWGEAMMVVLRCSIHLWSGRTADAVTEGRRALELFLAIGDRTGELQARCNLGRAELMAGDVGAGFAHLRTALAVATDAGGGDQVWMPGVALLNAAVQVGDVDQAGEILAVLGEHGGAERVDAPDRIAATALHRLQSGDVAGARDELSHTTERIGYVGAARALVAAAAGDVEGALEAAEAVAASGGTYLDVAYAGAARALAVGATGRVAEARGGLVSVLQLVEGTGDHVAEAVLRLVDAALAEAGARDDAASARKAADSRLCALDVEATGWRAVVDASLGTLHAG